GVLALLTTSAPDAAARNRALALFGAVSSGGMSIGLLLGGVLTDLGSWRWTMVINVPIGLVVLALTRRVLDETPRRPGRFDV
ncbi:MFS transporter, partial [Klebsiella pneumoniae]|nr:MFS transporter [Klebsiella pneumoniae]